MVLELFNSSLEFGNIFNYATINFTGNIFITLMFVLSLLLFIGILFRSPFLMVLVLCIPIIVVFSQYDWTGGFGIFLGIISIVLAFTIGKLVFAYR